MSRSPTVLIIGAGLSGLTAAALLRQEGIDVLVVEKGRGVGGRMATRRIGEAVFDHGAQFMTVRDSKFARAIADWIGSGAVKEWFRSEGPGEKHTRFRGNPSMTAVAKELSRSLEVWLSTHVRSLTQASRPGPEPRARAAWLATMESGETMFADAVLITAPVPQALALLDAGETALPHEIRNELGHISYERCIAVMARIEKKSALPEKGWFIPTEGPVAWMADNQLKGVSPVPAVTIHAGARFSKEHWEDDRRRLGEELLSVAQRWIGCTVEDFQVHGWRYSKPVRVSKHRCLGTCPLPANTMGKYRRVDHEATALPPVVFAGDAFGGPRVEGAFLSGRAAADYLMREMKWGSSGKESR